MGDFGKGIFPGANIIYTDEFSSEHFPLNFDLRFTQWFFFLCHWLLPPGVLAPAAAAPGGFAPPELIFF